MLEYFTYKKIKKQQAEKMAEAGVQSPVLSEEDENFLGRIVSAEGTPPPLPERPRFGPEAGDSTNNQAQMVVHDGNGTTEAPLNHEKTKDKGKGKENEKHAQKDAKKTSSRFSFLHRSSTKKVSSSFRPQVHNPIPN
jgi:hypothetical protein